MAAEVAQLLELLDALDALGDHAEPERASERDDGRRDRASALVGVDRGDERAVELEQVERRARERRERRAAGAEIVGDDLRAERTERGDRPTGARILAERAARQLEPEPRHREPGALGDLAHLSGKRWVGHRGGGQVDVQAQPGPRRIGDGAAGCLEHETIEQRSEQAVADVRHQTPGRDRSELGVLHAGERLDRDDLAGRDGDDRLVRDLDPAP